MKEKRRKDREETLKRLKQQMEFIVDVDKVKNIFRQTFVASGFVGSSFAGTYGGKGRYYKSDNHGTDP